jgi:hypothetical protein
MSDVAHLGSNSSPGEMRFDMRDLRGEQGGAVIRVPECLDHGSRSGPIARQEGLLLADNHWDPADTRSNGGRPTKDRFDADPAKLLAPIRRRSAGQYEKIDCRVEQPQIGHRKLWQTAYSCVRQFLDERLIRYRAAYYRADAIDRGEHPNRSSPFALQILPAYPRI